MKKCVQHKLTMFTPILNVVDTNKVFGFLSNFILEIFLRYQREAMFAYQMIERIFFQK